MAVLSVERDLGAHGDGALRRHRPQLGASPVAGGTADQLEGRRVEERRPRLRRVGAHCATGIAVAREVEEESRGQRSVHDKAGIALRLHGPSAGVVGAGGGGGGGGAGGEEDGGGGGSGGPGAP